jgi:hypothetical protein
MGRNSIRPYERPFGAGLSHNAIAENSAIGTAVGTVSGFDIDADDVVRYSLLDSAGGRFAIDAVSGLITVANGAALDYETAHSYDYGITVRVSDQNGNSVDRDFTIALIDRDETPTGALLTGGGVLENAASGYLVGQVRGVDIDPTASFNYSMLDSAGGRFAINASNGEIRVAGGAAIDYVTAHSYLIKVRTADQAGHAFDKDFTIAVTDVFDPHVVNDFNGDGRSDILLRSDGGSLVAWEMNNSQVIATDVIATGVPANWKIAGAADFSGDEAVNALIAANVGIASSRNSCRL